MIFSGIRSVIDMVVTMVKEFIVELSDTGPIFCPDLELAELDLKIEDLGK